MNQDSALIFFVIWRAQSFEKVNEKIKLIYKYFKHLIKKNFLKAMSSQIKRLPCKGARKQSSTPPWTINSLSSGGLGRVEFFSSSIKWSQRRGSSSGEGAGKLKLRILTLWALILITKMHVHTCTDIYIYIYIYMGICIYII